MSELFAFYGTLMSGLPPRANRPDLAAHVELVGPCLIPGMLYDVGPYPALALDDGVVTGELWRTRSPEAVAVLDAWEGYEAEVEGVSPYLRRRLRLLEPELDAWAYVWGRPVDGLVPIPDGDWRRHVQAAGAADA